MYFKFTKPPELCTSKCNFKLSLEGQFFLFPLPYEEESGQEQNSAYELEDQGSIFGTNPDLSLRFSIHTGRGVHTASYPVDTIKFPRRIKRPEREAYQFSPTSVEVKNLYLHSLLRFHAMVLH
jgi:hypothetical protein